MLRASGRILSHIANFLGERMELPGERVRRTRLVRTEKYIVTVEVEALIPDEDPSEACYGPDVVELLREVEARAKSGDVEWLKYHGKVYAALEDA